MKSEMLDDDGNDLLDIDRGKLKIEGRIAEITACCGRWHPIPSQTRLNRKISLEGQRQENNTTVSPVEHVLKLCLSFLF